MTVDHQSVESLERAAVEAGYKSAINKLTSPTAWELAKKYVK